MDNLSARTCPDLSNLVYIGIYFGLIIFFTYYVSITFNPDERADDEEVRRLHLEFGRVVRPQTICAMR